MGQQIGQQIVDKKVNSAAARYAQGDQNALADVMKYDAGMGMQLQQRQAQQQRLADEQAAKQREAIRTNAIQTARLLDGVGDEATYQQRLGVARQLQMPLDGVPPNFDPNWVAEQQTILKFVAEKPEALSTFGKIATDEGLQPGSPQFNARVTQLVKADALKTVPLVPGGGVAGVNTMDGSASLLIAPNSGGAQTGAPVNSGPAPGTVVGGYRFKGGNPNDRNSWEPAGGQPGGNGPFVQ
jgi:hypothetical protein